MHTAVNKTGKQSIEKSRGGWNTKLHVVSEDNNVVYIHTTTDSKREEMKKLEFLFQHV